MRRKDREVTKKVDIEEVLKSCAVCRIAVLDGERKVPYIVPLNFGYEWKAEELKLYFHSALEGRKLELLRESPNVGFELDCGHELLKGASACAYGYAFQSIIGEGSIRILEEKSEKEEGLHAIMKHMSGGEKFSFPEKAVEAVAVLCMTCKKISCKVHK